MAEDRDYVRTSLNPERKEPTEIVAICPSCGAEDIGEKNVAYATLDVTEWELDPEGTPTPTAYGTDAGAEWWLEDDAKPYKCRGCEWEGTLDELKHRPKEGN